MTLRIVQPCIDRLVHGYPDERDDAIAALVRLGHTSVASLRTLLEDSAAAPVARADAVRVLGRIDDRDAREAVLHALADKAWQVREAACQSPILARDPRAVEALLPLLHGDDGWPGARLGHEACAALARCGPTATVPMLNMLPDSSPLLRVRAATTLGLLGNLAARDPLLACLTDPNRRVRAAAATALEFMGDASVCSSLLGLFDDAEMDVRNAAIDASAILRCAAAVDPLIVMLRSSGAGDGNSHAIARALGTLGDPRASGPLIEALAQVTNPAGMGSFVLALCAFDGCVVIKRLLPLLDTGRIGLDALPEVMGEPYTSFWPALNHGDAAVRKAAAGVVGHRSDPGLSERLIAALGHEEAQIRACAAVALGGEADQGALDALLLALNDPVAEVRTAVVQMLGALGGGRATDSLARRLTDASPTVRWQAALALVRLRDTRARDPLMDALEHGDQRSINEALEGLGILGDGQALALLLALARIDPADPAPVLETMPGRERKVVERLLSSRRADAVEALGRLGDPRAIEPLLEMLAMRPSYTIIRALSMLGDNRAVEPLLGLVDNQDAVIRYSVYEALGQLGDVRALPALRRAAEVDDDWADFNAGNADATVRAIARVKGTYVLPPPAGRSWPWVSV